MKVLIVDDDPVSQTKLEWVIQSLGHETIVAGDGEEGLELWQSERPRIVITDWMMPVMDGLESVSYTHLRRRRCIVHCRMPRSDS